MRLALTFQVRQQEFAVFMSGWILLGSGWVPHRWATHTGSGILAAGRLPSA